MRTLLPLALIALVAVPVANAQDYYRGWGVGPRAGGRSYGGWSGRPGAWNAGYTGWSIRLGAGQRYGDSYYSDASDYRGTGTFLGAIAGAIIGNNSGSLRHSAGLGALYGAGVGYVLGSAAETNARHAETADRTAAEEAHIFPATYGYSTGESVLGTSRSTPEIAPVRDPSPMAAANGLFGR